MADPRDGLFFVPRGAARPVVQPGEFPFAAAFLDHGHINGQTTALLQAGATLRQVFDPDPAKVAAFREQFPQAQPVDSLAAILDDPEIRLVAAAAVPSERAAIGLQVMAAGKDYFTDKAPFTTLEQLAAVRAAVAETGRKYLVYYAERLHNAPTFYAGELIREGAIGRVLQVLIMAPHNLTPESRPAWFFDKARYGGILTDIGSHQFEQFLYYAGAAGGRINYARVRPTWEIPRAPVWRTSAKPPSPSTRVPQPTAASTGSPRRPRAPGATAAPSCSAPTATSRCARTSTPATRPGSRA